MFVFMRSLLVCGFGLLITCTIGCKKSPPTSTGTVDASVTTTAASAVPKMPPAPEDVGGVPADATMTYSGLATKVLTHGAGTDHPGPFDRGTIAQNPSRPDSEACLFRRRPREDFRCPGIRSSG